MFRIKTTIFIIALLSIITYQVVAKRQGYVSPADILKLISKHVSVVAKIIGRTIAKLSDVFEFIKTVYNKIRELLGPIFDEIIIAVKDIFGESLNLLWQPIKEFFNGYFEVLENVQHQLFAVLVTLGYVFGGGSIFLIFMECIGLLTDRIMLRPSSYLLIVGSWLFTNFRFISFVYAKFCDILSWFETIFRYIRVYIQPILNYVQPAINHLNAAFHTMIDSPVDGIVAGLNDAWNSMRANNVECSRAIIMIQIPIVLIIIAAYFLPKYIEYMEHIKQHMDDQINGQTINQIN